jgi:uncharacterized protein
MPDRGAFVIPVHDLDIEGRSVRFPITVPWLRGALEACEMQPAGSEGRVEAHLTKTGNEVLVQGQIDVALVIPCARCLNPVELRPHIELSLLLRQAAGSAAVRHVAGASGNRGAGDAKHGAGAAHGGAPGSPRAAKDASDRGRSAKSSKSDDETEFDAEDADIDTYEGEEVVLDRFVREAILLESPIFPLCSEACEGIRPASDSATDSQDAVTDPRLLPLLELAKRRKMKE